MDETLRGQIDAWIGTDKHDEITDAIPYNKSLTI